MVYLGTQSPSPTTDQHRPNGLDHPSMGDLPRAFPNYIVVDLLPDLRNCRIISQKNTYIKKI